MNTPVQPGNSLLMDYHWAQMTEEERRDAARDLGVAEGWVARNLKISPQFARIAASQGLPLLEAAARDHPEDLTAREFFGHALEILDRPQDALHAFEAILRVEPNRELVLRSSGRLLDRLARHELARSAWQKTIAINPWRSSYRLALANNCLQTGDWPGAIAACREAIRLNPELVEARSLLVQSYLRSHKPVKADAEFQLLVRFYPASRDVWQQWYEQQKQDNAASVGAVKAVLP